MKLREDSVSGTRPPVCAYLRALPAPDAMPQFETERPGEAPRVVRARDPEDAVRRSFGVAAEVPVVLGSPDLRDAWADVHVGGDPAGRVRPHARMRFRRD